MFHGSTVWFHSINSDEDVIEIYNFIERLLVDGEFSLPSGPLSDKVFQRYSNDAVCAVI